MKIIDPMWGKESEWRIQYSFPIDFRFSSLQSVSVLTKHIEGYHNFLHKESVLFLMLHFIK